MECYICYTQTKYLSNYFEYNISDTIIEKIEKNTSFENFKDILSTIVTKQYGRSKIIFGKFLR